MAKYIPLPSGAHRVWHVNGVKFGASLYGYSPSSRCAYATPVGQCLKNLGQVSNNAQDAVIGLLTQLRHIHEIPKCNMMSTFSISGYEEKINILEQDTRT